MPFVVFVISAIIYSLASLCAMEPCLIESEPLEELSEVSQEAFLQEKTSTSYGTENKTLATQNNSMNTAPLNSGSLEVSSSTIAETSSCKPSGLQSAGQGFWDNHKVEDVSQFNQEEVRARKKLALDLAIATAQKGSVSPVTEADKLKALAIAFKNQVDPENAWKVEKERDEAWYKQILEDIETKYPQLKLIVNQWNSASPEERRTLEASIFNPSEENAELSKLQQPFERWLFLNTNFKKVGQVRTYFYNYQKCIERDVHALGYLSAETPTNRSAFRIASYYEKFPNIQSNQCELQAIATSIMQLTEVAVMYDLPDALMRDIQKCINNYVAAAELMKPREIEQQRTWYQFITGAEQPPAKIQSDAKKVQDALENAFQGELKISMKIANQLKETYKNRATQANTEGNTQEKKRFSQAANAYLEESWYFKSHTLMFLKIYPAMGSMDRYHEVTEIPLRLRHQHMSLVKKYFDRLIQATLKGDEEMKKKNEDLISYEYAQESMLLRIHDKPKKSLASKYLTSALRDIRETSAASLFGNICNSLDSTQVSDYWRASLEYLSRASKAREENNEGLAFSLKSIAVQIVDIITEAQTNDWSYRSAHLPELFGHRDFIDDYLFPERTDEKVVGRVQEKIVALKASVDELNIQ